MQNRRTFLTSVAFGAAAMAVRGEAVGPDSRIVMKADRPFRIMQATDTHYLPGDARSAVVDEMLETGLREEKPDLVVFTGDCVANAGMKAGWSRFAEIIKAHETPFAAVLGNHDDEGKFSRKEIIRYVSALPGSVTQPGPAALAGCGNYTIPIYAPDGKTLRFVLFFMDSLAYAPGDLRKNRKVGQYAWFTPGQIAWYREQTKQLADANGGKAPPALAFFHIPLPEYAAAWENRKIFEPIGKKNEAICAPSVNSGLFCAMLEGRNLLGCFCGHDHDNDYVAKLNGIALAYGRFTGGSNTYRHWENGVRLIDLAPDSPTANTFTRTLSGVRGATATLTLS